MKKLVLVDSAPWCMRNTLTELANRGIEIAHVFFFAGDAVPPEYEKLNSGFENDFGIRTERINENTFCEKMDTCLSDDGMFMLFNLDIGKADSFWERTNVRYACSKTNNGQGKIWFYTTGGKELKSPLICSFKNQIVDVIRYSDNQMLLDIAKIWRIADGLE